MLTKLEIVFVVRIQDGGQDVGVLLGLSLSHHAGHGLETLHLLHIQLHESHSLGGVPQVQWGWQILLTQQ